MVLWHSDKLEKKEKTLFEASRSKVTKKVVDEWFKKYHTFFSERNSLDKPHEMYNIDETGFSTGSKAGVVVGQQDKDAQMTFHI